MSFIGCERHVTRCSSCGSVYPVGNQHFCGTTPGYAGVVGMPVMRDRSQEIIDRLDRIEKLLAALGGGK